MESTRMMVRRYEKRRLLLDMVLAASVLVIVGLVEFGILPDHKGGFYCNDPKISFKFEGDTVTPAILATGTILVPLLTIWFVECCFLPTDEREECSSVKDFAIAGVRQSLRWYIAFLIGSGVVLFVTEIGKVVMGEPRPHFLYTCRPDSAQHCTPGRYISSYSCTNKDDHFWEVSDSTRSFPSGHSSMAFFMSVFMMWFIQVRLPADLTYLLVPWLHCVFLTWAVVCSLTRITDHRHHWWDVLTGSVLGIVGAILTVKLLCEGFVETGHKARSKIHDTISGEGHV